MTIRFKWLEEELTRYARLGSLVQRIAEEKTNYHTKLIDKLVNACQENLLVKNNLIK